MELVYILISIIEIIVTCYLVINLYNLSKKLENYTESINSVVKSFLDFAHIIKLASKITVLSKKYFKNAKQIWQLISLLKQFVAGAFIADFLKGKNKNFKFPAIVRKLLFFI